MDNYEKLSVIGKGSFGRALLCRNKLDKNLYVIKEIDISGLSKKEQAEATNEAMVLAKMKHPNIVTYKESFGENDNLYIVMDYADGGEHLEGVG